MTIIVISFYITIVFISWKPTIIKNKVISNPEARVEMYHIIHFD